MNTNMVEKPCLGLYVRNNSAESWRLDFTFTNEASAHSLVLNRIACGWEAEVRPATRMVPGLNGRPVEMQWEHDGYGNDDSSYVVSAGYLDGDMEDCTEEECDALTEAYAELGDEERMDAAVSAAEYAYEGDR